MSTRRCTACGVRPPDYDFADAEHSACKSCVAEKRKRRRRRHKRSRK